MLVLSRYLGEGFRVGETTMTVAVVGAEFVELAVTLAPATKPWVLTLGIGQRRDVTSDIRLTLITTRFGRVRLGIDYPRGMDIKRFDD